VYVIKKHSPLMIGDQGERLPVDVAAVNAPVRVCRQLAKDGAVTTANIQTLHRQGSIDAHPGYFPHQGCEPPAHPEVILIRELVPVLRKFARFTGGQKLDFCQISPLCRFGAAEPLPSIFSLPNLVCSRNTNGDAG
jgi:hypothetical protein